MSKTFSYRRGAVKVRVRALGVYFAKINGKRVNDLFLSPGWTDYRKTLQEQEYDLGGLLKIGDNIRFSSIYDGETQDYVYERKSLTPVETGYNRNLIVRQITRKGY